MSTDTDLIAAAVLRRNAHALRNKLSALISGIDIIGHAAPRSSELMTESLALLAESAAELRALADGWTAAAREMFEQRRDLTCCGDLARIAGAAAGAPVMVEGDPAIETRIDPRVFEELARQIAAIAPLSAVAIRQVLRHDLPFVVVAFEVGELEAVRLAETELIQAVVNQLGAYARVEGKCLVVQLQALQAILQAAS